MLGCAERQIQRYTAAGKLTVEYQAEGKTRKATYLEDEVMALKEQQAAPELRGIAIRPLVAQPPPLAADNQPATTNNPLTLPPQALQVLQMLGTMAKVEEGQCVSVEEVKFEKLLVRADGSTRMSGVSVSRYNARA